MCTAQLEICRILVVIWNQYIFWCLFTTIWLVSGRHRCSIVLLTMGVFFNCHRESVSNAASKSNNAELCPDDGLSSFTCTQLQGRLRGEWKWHQWFHLRNKTIYQLLSSLPQTNTDLYLCLLHSHNQHTSPPHIHVSNLWENLHIKCRQVAGYNN